MTIRWSRLAPQLALSPSVAVTVFVFLGGICWTIYLSFTASRRFPDYTLVGFRQYVRLFKDAAWIVSLENAVIFAIGSLASIALGFILAALIDKEARGEAVFRTVFLYPLAISLIVTGLIWRWLFNPDLGVENVFYSIGWNWVHFNWLADPSTVMYKSSSLRSGNRPASSWPSCCRASNRSMSKYGAPRNWTACHSGGSISKSSSR